MLRSEGLRKKEGHSGLRGALLVVSSPCRERLSPALSGRSADDDPSSHPPALSKDFERVGAGGCALKADHVARTLFDKGRGVALARRLEPGRRLGLGSTKMNGVDPPILCNKLDPPRRRDVKLHGQDNGNPAPGYEIYAMDLSSFWESKFPRQLRITRRRDAFPTSHDPNQNEAQEGKGTSKPSDPHTRQCAA